MIQRNRKADLTGHVLEVYYLQGKEFEAIVAVCSVLGEKKG
ncbi:MAG: hypothetical protein Q8N83_10790 [Ignavibacteria bacterium]|nr:hypothetical protein [Ignavibacteria bacterium]